ncbi:Spc98 family-domain-containing protein [Lipomyces japonicus]|uniref:Spc98 family-domain-containing protein n=1 Tax=Lipomyces japonicus TaxID=56871 RepID=UPI0034CE65B5
MSTELENGSLPYRRAHSVLEKEDILLKDWTVHTQRAPRLVTKSSDDVKIKKEMPEGLPKNALSKLQLEGSNSDKVSSSHASETRPSTTSHKTQWYPEVKLLNSSVSSLGTRITSPPLSYQIFSHKRPLPLDKMTTEVQHATIMEDLLYVLMGTEGQYIRYHERYNPTVETNRIAGPEFRLAKGLDPSLRDLTKILLNMATHYSSIEAFIELQSKVEYGVVNHALCAAMRKVLREYLKFITDMEYRMLTDSNFSLNRFHVETLDFSRKLQEIYWIVQKINKKESNDEIYDNDNGAMTDFDKIMETLKANDGDLNVLNTLGISKTTSTIKKGGYVIKILTERLYSVSGDPSAKELLTILLREASKPYMKMLNKWLHRGIISDPFNEFLIREQKSIHRQRLDEDYTDEYWEKRYTIRKEDLPPQIADSRVCDKILLAGKFLNVVRECGGVDVSIEMKDAPETIDDPRLLSKINAAYAHANGNLLSLLLNTHELAARLTSLKHYFFLDQADFFTNFLDVAWHELKKPIKNVSVSKLQSLLDLTLRQPGSITAVDPLKEDISLQLNEVSLTDWLIRIVSVSGLDPTDLVQTGSSIALNKNTIEKDDKKSLTGIQALQFDFSIPFPLSLVISRKTILRYQLLFRHLVALKNLEQLLGLAWLETTKNAGWIQISKSRQLQKWKAKAWNLRAKMLVFIQQVLYFSTTEVMEPNWSSLMSGIKDIKTVDILMQNHVDFLDTCLKECMLTNARLLRVMAKLMSACKGFALYVAQLSKSMSSITSEIEAEDGLEKVERLFTVLQQYESNFDHNLKVLMDALNYYAATETVVLLSLCARLEVCMTGETRISSGI